MIVNAKDIPQPDRVTMLAENTKLLAVIGKTTKLRDTTTGEAIHTLDRSRGIQISHAHLRRQEKGIHRQLVLQVNKFIGKWQSAWLSGRLGVRNLLFLQHKLQGHAFYCSIAARRGRTLNILPLPHQKTGNSKYGTTPTALAPKNAAAVVEGTCQRTSMTTHEKARTPT